MLSHSGRTAALVAKYRPAMVTPARTGIVMMNRSVSQCNLLLEGSTALLALRFPLLSSIILQDKQFHDCLMSDRFVEQLA